MNNIVTIYTISCPFTDTVKYVGKTISPLDVRLKQHLGLPTNAKMKYWIQSLNGIIPIISEIDTTDLCHADEIEMYWIQQFRAWGIELLNVSMNYVKNEKITLCVNHDFYEAFKHFVSERPHYSIEKAIIHAAKTGLEMIEEKESSHVITDEEMNLRYYTQPKFNYDNSGFDLPF